MFSPVILQKNEITEKHTPLYISIEFIICQEQNKLKWNCLQKKDKTNAVPDAVPENGSVVKDVISPADADGCGCIRRDRGTAAAAACGSPADGCPSKAAPDGRSRGC